MIDFLIAARAVHFAATAIAAGGTLFVAAVVGPARGHAAASDYLQRLGAVLRFSVVLAIVSGAGWLMAAVALIDVPVWDVLRKTEYGHVWIARLALALVLLGMMKRSPAGLTAFLSMSLMGSLAWSGHAAGSPGGLGMLHRAADMLHLCACGAWLGGLPALALLIVFALRQREPVTLQAAVRRFSTIGVVSVATLLATGFFNTWMLAASPQALLDTDYGNLLLLKIVLFAAMLILAGMNRWQLTPALPGKDAARRLARNSLVELGLGGAIIAVVAILGTLPPPAHLFF
jgi:putative copper resistance protein D